MITLTSDQAFSAARAVEVRRDALIERAAKDWVYDTTPPDELALEIFGWQSEPVDPEINLARHEANFLADDQIYSILMGIPQDDRISGDTFRYWVMETASRILNNKVRNGQELTAEQSRIASLDFGRV